MINIYVNTFYNEVIFSHRTLGNDHLKISNINQCKLANLITNKLGHPRKYYDGRPLCYQTTDKDGYIHVLKIRGNNFVRYFVVNLKNETVKPLQEGTKHKRFYFKLEHELYPKLERKHRLMQFEKDLNDDLESLKQSYEFRMNNAFCKLGAAIGGYSTLLVLVKFLNEAYKAASL